MNTIKKTVSVLLAVMMIFSMLTIVSVSAAETNTITVTSNLCDAVEYTYDEDDAQIKVTYKFQSDKMLLNAQGVLTYDSKVLKLADKTTANSLPVLKAGSAVANFGIENKVKFNSTSLNPFDFTTEDVFFTVTFDIIGSGNTTVDLDVEVITATTAKNYEDVLAGAEDIDLVYFGTYDKNAFTFSSDAEITSKSTSNVSIVGDINLTLEETDTGVYSGYVDLQAGTYKFNVNDNGTTCGMNFTYTDTATIDYSAGYKAATTFKATGGRYTFTYKPSAKLLKITYKPFAQLVELFGDINIELVKGTGTMFTGYARVEAGTYNFKINDQGTVKGFGFAFDDVVYDVKFNANYSSSATFNATGGVYSVKYDTATSALTFMKAPAGLGDVTVFGDISLPLAAQGNGIYSAITVLEAGTYDIRVDSFGTVFGCGSSFIDTINTEFKTEWKASAAFTATSKMKFTFVFDTNTNKVKVFNAPIDASKVLVAFEDSNLELKKGADGIYTATKALTAGTYSIRMDEFGVTMGYGGNFTDSYAAQYNASFKAATTFTATGGNYTFAFNTNTNTLTVKKA